MNVLIIVDKYGSAIWRLAELTRRHLDHLDIKVFPVHPKRNDLETISEAQQLLKWADLIDIHYWKSGDLLWSMFPIEMEEKPKILCHFNPYDCRKQNWLKRYNAVTVGNREMNMMLPYAFKIPYGIDLEFFTSSQRQAGDRKIVNMVAARIEGKKGILPVAQACQELGYTLEVVGMPSNPEYIADIQKLSCVNYLGNVSDEDLRSAYHRASLHICNSVDDFESGPLPILEAMACGTPVLTRMVGHVPDIYDGANLELLNALPEDVEYLKKRIREVMENDLLRKKMSERAYRTVKNRSYWQMADRYGKLYYRIFYANQTMVSVVVPTCNRREALIKVLAAIAGQTHKAIEVVVVESGDLSSLEVAREFKKKTKIPIKYIGINRREGDYTLAKARNLGAMAADGELLLFCDDRLAMRPEAVEEFVKNKIRKIWSWGEKDGSPKQFVENFSAIHREDFMQYGMFNERIDTYGGMTQETHHRFSKNGMDFFFVPSAKAYQVLKSGSKWGKMLDIAKSKYKIWRMYGD